ncbi:MULTISPECIES: TorF family putative porin [Acinetobacter]|uniref:Porin n=1 Tax=Acinetobacter piscicola TaxID=2006115 RepID=A0A7S7AGL0_9GAMM|nr:MULTISPECIES: TorF family putative porin [Acinetobacter]QOW44716.1 hypothetical protein G0028_01685 [Acinetobacter piscicola]
MTASFSKKMMVVPCLLLISSVVYAEDTALTHSNGVLSGSVGTVSKYIYRGGVENDDIALQAGLDYAHKSGISVGYWGSTLDYDATDENRHRGFEHDVYMAYGHEIRPDLSYNVQATAYVYHHGGTVYGDEHKRKTTAFDVLGALTYKEVTVAGSVLLADASFGNAGDVYLSAAYSHALPKNFTLNASVGGSAYNSSRDDEMIQTTQDFAFNEARIGLSNHLAESGVVASVDYVLGGEDRLGEDFDNHVVFGLNYNF